MAHSQGGLYRQDPDNSKKQVPNTNNIDIMKRVGYSMIPAALSMSKRPNQVIVTSAGTYAFAYESGSVSTYITGSVMVDDNGPISLDINPVAWRQTDAAGSIGDITFVYTGNVG